MQSTYSIEVPPEMAGSFESILHKGEYAPPGWYVGPSAIVDIGANIGLASIYFNGLWPNVPIRSFEPSKENFAYLHKNTAQFSDTITLVNAAVSNWLGVGDLYHGLSNCGEASLYQGPEQRATSELVAILPASEVLAELPEHSLVKIDTEGSERAIFENAGDLILKADIVMFEYHSEDDRRWIDQHLGERDFLLYKGYIRHAHRGILRYVHRRTKPDGFHPNWFDQ
jgi:FkbM family methyltransferase